MLSSNSSPKLYSKYTKMAKMATNKKKVLMLIIIIIDNLTFYQKIKFLIYGKSNEKKT